MDSVFILIQTKCLSKMHANSANLDKIQDDPVSFELHNHDRTESTQTHIHIHTKIDGVRFRETWLLNISNNNNYKNYKNKKQE